MIRNLLGAAAIAGAMLASTAASAQCVAGASSTILYAGQTTPIGTVDFAVVGDNLAVTYNIDEDAYPEWYLDAVHLWVGTTLVDMPQTPSGNPKFGQFPYNYQMVPYTTSYTVDVPLQGDEIDFICPGAAEDYLVVAHAAVFHDADADGEYDCYAWDVEDEYKCVDGEEGETAIGYGEDIPDATRWGWYFTVTLSCSCGGDTPNGCETAYAYAPEPGGHCFIDEDWLAGLDYDVTGGKWGWTLGPITESVDAYYYDIYAGAGQCDLDAGYLIGELSVYYFGGTAVITATMDGDLPYTFEEAQTWVGSDVLPLECRKQGKSTVCAYTTAPGQYGHLQDLTGAVTYTEIVSGLSGSIYVAAHSVTCGF